MHANLDCELDQESTKPPKPPTWIELESVKVMGEVETITTLSRETIKRRYGRYVVRLSARREGMKLRHALAITRGELD
jgi:hypothetical protein